MNNGRFNSQKIIVKNTINVTNDNPKKKRICFWCGDRERLRR